MLSKPLTWCITVGHGKPGRHRSTRHGSTWSSKANNDRSALLRIPKLVKSGQVHRQTRANANKRRHGKVDWTSDRSRKEPTRPHRGWTYETALPVTAIPCPCVYIAAVLRNTSGGLCGCHTARTVDAEARGVTVHSSACAVGVASRIRRIVMQTDPHGLRACAASQGDWGAPMRGSSQGQVVSARVTLIDCRNFSVAHERFLKSNATIATHSGHAQWPRVAVCAWSPTGSNTRRTGHSLRG